MPSSLQEQEEASNNSDREGADVEMSDAAAASNHATHTIRQDVVMDSIFQHLLQNVCIDVAATLHQHIKTNGGMGVPTLASHIVSAKQSDDGDEMVSPTVQSRLQLFPELYEGKRSAEEIQELMEQYAVDLPMVDSRKDRSRKRLGTTTTTNGGGQQWASDEDDNMNRLRDKAKRDAGEMKATPQNKKIRFD